MKAARIRYSSLGSSAHKRCDRQRDAYIGDTDLTVSGGETLTFTSANWNTPQTVTLSAAEDADTVNGTAIFSVASSGLTTVNVNATLKQITTRRA